MAARKSFLNYFNSGTERINPMITSETQFEFDESDVWNSNNNQVVISSDQITKKPSLPIKKKSLKKVNNQRQPIGAASLPVDVPDWSMILGNEYDRTENRDDVDEVVDVDVEDRLPPHEYLARTRGSSFSVHEGIGRTLKGRDLSRVRNAVWKQIGFED